MIFLAELLIFHLPVSEPKLRGLSQLLPHDPPQSMRPNHFTPAIYPSLSTSFATEKTQPASPLTQTIDRLLGTAQLQGDSHTAILNATLGVLFLKHTYYWTRLKKFFQHLAQMYKIKFRSLSWASKTFIIGSMLPPTIISTYFFNHLKLQGNQTACNSLLLFSWAFAQAAPSAWNASPSWLTSDLSPFKTLLRCHLLS